MDARKGVPPLRPDVVVHDERVEIRHGTEIVATHVRSTEPFARVIDPTHYAGLWRATVSSPTRHWPAWAVISTTYAAVVAGGDQ